MPAKMKVAEATARMAGIQGGPLGHDLGAPLQQPVVVVDLEDTQPELGLQPPPGLPCVVVARSRLLSPPPAPHGPDVLISAGTDPPRPWIGADGDVEASTEALVAAIRQNPVAATTFVQVLRVGRTLGAAEALVVESLAYSTLQAGPEHRSWLEARPRRETDERTEPTVRVERHDNELWVTLDRPERRNAYSARMRDELVAALEIAGADSTVTSVHLQGRGPNFCSGGDLAEFGTLPDPASAHAVRTQRSAGWWMSELGPRVTVHLHGACVGAGIELAAFAGAVEATEDATFTLPEVRMGLIPGAGGTVSIPRRIGTARTAWLAISGSRLSAVVAARWGLIDRLLPVGSEPSRL
jgi:enoyl-CoA hydratase/carnithine racemase